MTRAGPARGSSLPDVAQTSGTMPSVKMVPMRSPLPDYLGNVLAECAPGDEGTLADYIPELAHVDPDRFALAIATIDGAVYSVGDDRAAFTIQSISKPFVYALAIEDSGFDEVLRRIDVEPSGNAFNELSLQAGSNRPYNPMINAGAIAAHSLVVDGAAADEHERIERILAAFSTLAGRELRVDESVFESEYRTAHRNLGIAHMLRASGTIVDDPEDIVRGYTRQCAIEVTVRDLALMSATLANGGRHPLSGERVMRPRVVRQVLSVMMSCGMYDAAGDWITNVGIPAKSGVSGGVTGSLPGQVGLAAFSPRIDAHGNSVRGVRAFERLSDDLGLHLMEAAQPARSVMREVRHAEGPDGRDWLVVELFGSVQFTGAERIARAFAELAGVGDDGPARIAVDLRNVFSVTGTASRMLVESLRRLAAEGRRVVLSDPDGVLEGGAAGGLGDATREREFVWQHRPGRRAADDATALEASRGGPDA